MNDGVQLSQKLEKILAEIILELSVVHRDCIFDSLVCIQICPMILVQWCSMSFVLYPTLF